MQTALARQDLAAHTAYLTAYATRHVSDRDLAQDLVQETLLAALTSGTGFAGRSALRTWLTGILKHKIMDHYRERSRAPVSLDAMIDEGADPSEDALAGSGHASGASLDPAQQLEHARFREAFLREISRMPARTAQAFLMSEFSGCDSGEVCRELGISSNALWVMRFRARDALRKALAPAFA